MGKVIIDEGKSDREIATTPIDVLAAILEHAHFAVKDIELD